MTCKHCHDLCLVQPIDHDEQLDNALAIIRDGIAGATLHEVLEVHVDRHRRVTFDQFLETGLGKDPVELSFACAFCDERFMLRVNPLPKLKGEWTPIHAESRRLRQ